MADGTVQDGGIVSVGGQQHPPFFLDADENIVRIVTRQSDALSGLQIYTSKGRESVWFGGHAGPIEDFVASSEDPIVSFERNEGGTCPKFKKIVRLQKSRQGFGLPSTRLLPTQVIPSWPDLHAAASKLSRFLVRFNLPEKLFHVQRSPFLSIS
jgi:hypothetical protein